MTKKRKPAPAPVDPAMAPWLQRFTLLDSSYCFLANKKAPTSLKNVLRLAAHLSGSSTTLLESHVRQMASIGVVRVVTKAADKVIAQDDFNPTDLPETIEVVEFQDVPHASKRGSTKRLELFTAALAAFDVAMNPVPEYLPPPKRPKAVPTWTHEAATAETVDAWIQSLVTSSFYSGQLVHVERLPARAAVYGPTPLAQMPLAPALVSSLHIEKLYAHQATGIDALLNGHHVAISTSTSSGKSMVYNIPVANSLLTEAASTHLYLFPTKALAQDQMQSLRSFLMRCGLPPSICATYDGDTTHPERTVIRKSTRVFLTNPDMLHVTILPQHKTWASILTHLRYIVIDESHMYRGLFGSHVAWILRRLRRLCALYGSQPQVVCCSASIHNPEEHFRFLVPPMNGELRARPLTLVPHASDGSPSGPKAFLIWNPLAHDDSTPDASNSAIFQAGQILSTLVQKGVHTIAFCRGRKLTELVLDYAHTQLRKAKQFALVERVKAYRGGYTAEDRRAIEADLFQGDLLGVVATNALELGIDIGNLECTLHIGFPSSVSSLWQQAGRAGRSGKDSLAVLLGFSSPLDQYYLKTKKRCATLFTKDFESAVLDPLNAHVMAAHLQCASLEMHLFSTKCGNEAIDRSVFPPEADAVLASLVASGRLQHRHPLGYQVPALLADDVRTTTKNIRQMGNDNYSVVEGEKVLDTHPSDKVFFTLYPRAVYLFQGREYVVTKVDTEAKLAFVTRSHKRLTYYTAARDFTDVNVSLPFPRSNPPYHDSVHLGRVSATTHVVGCHLIEKRTQKKTGLVEFSLPPMDTTGHGVWIDVPEALLAQLPRESHRHAVHGINHLVLAVIPLFMLIDPSDVHTEHANFNETRARPTRVILYESHDGGVGIVSRIARCLPEILACAKDILDGCACKNGCPSCIQSATCSEYNGALDKSSSKRMLDYLHTMLSTHD
ncbi:hypothetical protein SPRG_09971 [Saprolegnia parasitica CBS 223.65]|uniref:DEAD/DEAH box helicase n=1 Tax=Saprolegnia parasitica (strain CBS 223.65) TaxID=695850 RepID=A0A067BY14_SAPPC|nr:hypothetical protein SPRG_09971 [Saprolegnia parasitica CBS 223.65]KDO23163.1 hypothetical protein SPRG_09971 [Saprolegnia parasitica CBS 223.65]|eukprot:XP_012206115.1 hypothetical protein SPRG_09971 [Saprolegnia parasitica CBS 223.65]